MTERLREAVRHHQAGRLDQAERLYRDILKQDPNHADALHLLGLLANQAGHRQAALDLIDRALGLRPAAAPFQASRGDVLQALGRHEEALSSFDQATAIDGDHAEALTGGADCLAAMGREDEAEARYREVIALRPAEPEFLFRLGAHVLGQGFADLAAGIFDKVLKLSPELASAAFNLGTALKSAGRYQEAEAAIRRGLATEPDSAEGWSNLAGVVAEAGNLGAAVELYGKALEIRPGSSEIHSNLGGALLRQGRVDKAVESYGRALEHQGENAGAHSNLLLARHYQADSTPEQLRREAAAWNTRHAAAPVPDAHSNLAEPDRKLKIGYVSDDLREHSVGYFAQALLADHDRKAFEITCYAGASPGDALSRRLRRQVEHWRVIGRMSDDDAAALIARDGIDILVDLSGHTLGNRLTLFTRKPAPVQVTYLGYPGTTGLAAMDYRLTDATADPDGFEAHYAERLVRLPGCFLCYGAPVESPPISAPPLKERGYPTFGSFNNLAKVGPGVIEVWAQILDRVAGARLLLKHRSLADDATRERYLKLFESHGIGKNRLEFENYLTETEKHLACYGNLDVALDSFPYNGTTTTCEALWMGVPVITLQGERHSGRVGASILEAAGHSGLIATETGDYVEKAVALASDEANLVNLRAGLRDRMKESALMDSHRFVRDAEAAYRDMWRRWCGQRKSI